MMAVPAQPVASGGLRAHFDSLLERGDRLSYFLVYRKLNIL